MYIYEPTRRVREHVLNFDFHETDKTSVNFVSKISFVFFISKKASFNNPPQEFLALKV